LLKSHDTVVNIMTTALAAIQQPLPRRCASFFRFGQGRLHLTYHTLSCAKSASDLLNGNIGLESPARARNTGVPVEKNVQDRDVECAPAMAGGSQREAPTQVNWARVSLIAIAKESNIVPGKPHGWSAGRDPRACCTANLRCGGETVKSACFR